MGGDGGGRNPIVANNTYLLDKLGLHHTALLAHLDEVVSPNLVERGTMGALAHLRR